MGSLDHHGNTLRLQHLFNGVGDLRRQALLDLKPFGISFHDPRKLGDTNDTAIRDIGYPSAPDDRRNVMFAMAFERNSAKTTISS